MEEKKTLSQEVVCVKMVDFETSMALQREPFLTMFYNINLSPLLVTKERFYANNYFE
jgi:hypothetical protein